MRPAPFHEEGGLVFPIQWPYFSDRVALKLRAVWPLRPKFTERTYIALLSRITYFLKEDVSIVYDSFNIPSFDEKVVHELSKLMNVQAIMGRNSQSEPGLQLADNLCSVFRHYKTTRLKTEWYEMLESRILEV